MKNKQLSSLELYIPQEVEIHYKRPLFSTMKYIKSSEDVVKILRLCIDPNKIDHKEFFWLLIFNRANRLLGFSEIGRGSNAGVVINYKEIFQLLLLTNSDCFVVAHNHPSGSLNISGEDKKQTRKLVEMSQLISIRLLDHLIITSESYISLADKGIL